VFKKVDELVGQEVCLTSFSILFARLKGDLKTFIDGTDALDSLKQGDKILICESCTHHSTDDDIGRVKIPALVNKFTGKEPEYVHFSGYDFPENVREYALIVHCGACMTNRKEMLSRMALAAQNGVAITNYGVIIAKCTGILQRATRGLI
jgi:hypothetical protein